jgi:hypothetical protein
MLDNKNPYNGVINQNGYNTSWPREYDLRGRELGAKAGIQRIEKPHLTDGRLEQIAKGTVPPAPPSDGGGDTGTGGEDEVEVGGSEE